MSGIRAGFRNPLLTGVEIPDGIITTTKIADAAITTAKIANLAVTNAKVNDLSADKINAGMITALRFRTAASGRRLEIRGDTGDSFVSLWNAAGTKVGEVGIGTTGFGLDELTMTGTDRLNLDSGADILLDAAGSAGFGVIIVNPAPAGGTPATPFMVEAATGPGFRVVNSAAEATPSWAFDSDDDTGIRRTGANGLAVVTGGTDVMGFAANVYRSDASAVVTNTTPRIVIGPDYYIGVRASSTVIFTGRNSDGAAIDFYRSGSLTGGIGTTTGTLTMYAGTTRVLSVLAGGSSSSLFLLDGLTDVGNHETLRLDRGTGTIMRAVGYFSSRRGMKREIVPLERSKLWRREWFDRLQPVKFRRRSTQGREFGFIIEDLAEISRFLTTKGDRVGDSPDEFALLAVTVDALKAARSDIRQLESRVTELEAAA